MGQLRDLMETDLKLALPGVIRHSFAWIEEQERARSLDARELRYRLGRSPRSTVSHASQSPCNSQSR